MPLSRALKCIFIHVPRTGGTSIESALNILGDWRNENLNLMFGYIQSVRIKQIVGISAFLQHLTAAELRAIIPNEFGEYFRFAFVRNPWERMVSIYARMDPHMVEQAKRSGVDPTSMVFDDFAEWAREFKHVHLLPQSDFLFDDMGNSLVDFTGRYERLAEDFAFISGKLGLSIELSRQNKTSHAPYREYYTAKARKIVEDMYEQDIQRFNYKF